MKLLSLSLSFLGVSASPQLVEQLPTMVQFLDDMQTHYKGDGAKYNRVFLDDLSECLVKWDDETLLISQNAAWAGIDSYWKSNGTDTDSRGLPDHWGECSMYDDERNCNMDGHMWLRHTPELFGPEKIIMYEPCNYVSNVAYYHSANRVCTYPEFASGDDYQKALKRSFASLTIGSAMMHGSFTNVGTAFDCQMISIIAYLSHQISTSNSPCVGDCNVHMLKELSDRKRNITSIEFSDKITQAFIDDPVPEWAEVLNTGDYPRDMFVNFGCLVGTVTNVLFPEFIADKLMKFLAYNTLLGKDSADFVYLKYNPTIRNALRDIKPKIPHEEIVIIGKKIRWNDYENWFCFLLLRRVSSYSITLGQSSK
jgi:hypothetical protein